MPSSLLGMHKTHKLKLEKHTKKKVETRQNRQKSCITVNTSGVVIDTANIMC